LPAIQIPKLAALDAALQAAPVHIPAQLASTNTVTSTQASQPSTHTRATTTSDVTLFPEAAFQAVVQMQAPARQMPEPASTGTGTFSQTQQNTPSRPPPFTTPTASPQPEHASLAAVLPVGFAQLQAPIVSTLTQTFTQTPPSTLTHSMTLQMPSMPPER
jgi:hypothetical protein